MTTLDLGSFALPLNPLLMLAGWWMASLLAQRLAGASRLFAAKAFTRAGLVGLLAARVSFVVQAFDAYAASPASVLDLRDGGWSPWVGLAASLGVLAWFGLRRATLRKPLVAGAIAGLALWSGLSAVLGVHDGPALPALTLQRLDGTPIVLSPSLSKEVAGSPTVINLWATWCPPCQAEMPLLASAQQREKGVRFVFVNQGESAAVVQRWLSQQPYVLGNVLLDTRMQVGAAVGSAGMPTTLFYDASGRLVERHVGPLSAASLEGKLGLLRNGFKP
jgi:thiol-disulfide isomerase/thioredoxin